MPAITSQPNTTSLQSAYGTSLNYTVTQSFTSGDPIPAMEARIIINGSTFSTQFFTPSSSTATVATFSININGIVQEYFDSINAYPGSFTGYVNTSNASNIALVSVVFYPWLANADGLLELDASFVTSATSKTINSAQTSLSNFYAASNRKFLTNKPNNTILKSSEGELLAIYSTVTSEVIVKTYNALGLQGTYTKTLDGFASSRVVVIGVGLVNLLLMQAAGWTTQSGAGGDMLDGGTSKYYTIQVKQSGGSVFSETRTYYLDTSDSCLAYRIWFLNRLGFYDGVSLYSSTYDTFSTESTLFESPVSEVNLSPRNRISSKLTKGFVADFLQLTDEETVWLKELANTIDAYENSLSNPVIVEDVSNAVEKDTYAAIPQLVFSFVYSNQEYSHRN